MNIDYLRLWKYVPIMLIGGGFFIEVCILFRGNLLISDTILFFQYIKNIGGEFLSALIFIFLIFIISITGIKILRSIVHLFGIMYRYIVKRILHDKVSPELRLEDFELAIYLFDTHKEQILDFFILKSLSTPEIAIEYPKMKNYIQQHIKNIITHIRNIKNYELARLLAYYSSVTQEQVFEEHLKDEIRTIQYSWIAIPLLPIVLIRLLSHNLNIFYSFMLSIVGILWILLSIPIYKYHKRKYAYYLIHSYLDPFTIAEWAQTVDREAY